MNISSTRVAITAALKKERVRTHGIGHAHGGSDRRAARELVRFGRRAAAPGGAGRSGPAGGTGARLWHRLREPGRAEPCR